MVYFSNWKTLVVLAIVVIGFVFASPNLLDRSAAEDIPSWLPHKQVSLGLDLQGGAHLLLEVDVKSVLTERAEGLQAGIRDRMRPIRREVPFRMGAQDLTTIVTVRDADKVQQAADVLRNLDNDYTMEVVENQIFFKLSDQALRDRQQSVLQQSVEIIRRRVDETGTKEPTIQRQGADRILLQVPGIEDPETLKRLIQQTAKMTFHLLHPNQSAVQTGGRAPPGAQFLPYTDAADRPGHQRPQGVVVRKRIAVSGESLIDAQPTFDHSSGQPVVSFRFDSRGARQFGKITRENVGRPFAIVLDGKVISDPVIREPILGGSGQISGGFTVQQATELSLLLRAGALPADITILEERTVGPGLGADSIAAGKFASIIGLVLVVIFMIMVYGLFGLFANVALLVNMVLILGGLSLLQATLTLPGIAGIVLTIGMAVDANVLVFERIKEEVRAGRTPISSVDAGYSRAITTIVDANLTTLIAALILFFFGTGPIRGFAVTLSIGIVTSMFTAIMLTRLLVVTWLRRRSPSALPL